MVCIFRDLLLLSFYLSMTRREVEENTIALLRTAGGTRPDLRVVELDGRRVVVKDFKRSDCLFRLFIGPILIAREASALARLQDVRGVPHFIQRIDRYAMAIEHVDGTALRDYRDPIAEGFFDRLAQVMCDIHTRGVTHCDLRSSGNVIIANGCEPVVVDFAASVVRGRGRNPFINLIFDRFTEADDLAVLMLKRKHAPKLLRPEEKERLATPLPYEEFAKSFGTAVRNLTRRLLTHRRKR